MPLITDATFSTFGNPDSKWRITCHKGVTMTPARQGDVLRLAIANTSGANWHGELLFAPFPVVEGETYRLSFSARADAPFAFSVWLGQMESPYSSLVTKENHFGEKLMTPDWQAFTHVWTASRSEPKARLDFVLGQIDNTVELQNVKLEHSK
ncbi:MAG: Carbohydrate binding domain [Rariglobus sp.]|jgi:hypothetical protein|nr:Carbohydrate binding domain [Rariglobus sp.]